MTTTSQMKVGAAALYPITRYGFPYSFDNYMKALQEMHDAGFKNVELEINVDIDLDEYRTRIDEVKEKLNALDLNLSATILVVQQAFSLDADAADETMRRFDIATQLIEEVGCEAACICAYMPKDVEMVAGTEVYRGSPPTQIRVPENFDWNTFWDNAVSRFRQMAKIAASRGQKLIIENRVGDFVNSSDGALKLVEDAGELSGLEAYDAARPPHSEGLAITIAAYLAHETDCTNINLLHLSSAKAIDAAMRMAKVFPQIDFRREVTVTHLLADFDNANGNFGKVNPPIRSREDVDALWQAVLDGNVDWVVSDHACCREEVKLDGDDPENVWLAKSGFGGTEFLLSGVLSEGTKRGLALHRIAELISWNPAQRYGLHSKGTIEEGYDADLVLLDPNETFTVRAADSESTQEYSPLEGHEMTGRVKQVFLRGTRIVDEGGVVGAAGGRYLSRPTS